MKLAYCIHSLYNSGGTERVLTEKVNALCRDYGYDITIITADQRGRKPFFALDPCVKTVDIGINFYRQSRLHRYMKSLESVLCELHPDICVSLSNYEIYGLADLKDGSIKVAEFHFTHDRWSLEKGRCSFKAWIRTLRMDEAAKKMAAFVVLTKEDAETWKRIVPGVKQIYNPSPFDVKSADHTVSGESKKMVAVGRLCKQKDFPTLIKAWKIVSKKYPDWSLHIYGDGEDRKNLESLIVDSGLGESKSSAAKVVLEQRVQDIRAEIKKAAALIMSSIYEGFPMALIEAQSLGLPLVSTNCKCGPSEIISEGKNGFLVPVRDFEAMADRICRLIEDTELRQKFSQNARKMAERFSSAKIISQWDSLFRELI